MPSRSDRPATGGRRIRCSESCRTVSGSGGHISTPIITCGSSVGESCFERQPPKDQTGEREKGSSFCFLSFQESNPILLFDLCYGCRGNLPERFDLDALARDMELRQIALHRFE